MENISTSQLIEEIARKTGQSKKDVQAALEALRDAIVSKLAAGGRVEIRGFASFAVEERAPRMGRNPRTGKAILIPMTRRVKVRMAQAVRRRVAEASLSTGAGVIIALEGDPWAEGLERGLAGIGYQVATGADFGSALRASRKRIRDIAFVMTGPSIDEMKYLVIARELKLDPATAMLPLVRRADSTRPRRSKSPAMLRRPGHTLVTCKAVTTRSVCGQRSRLQR